MFSFLFPNKINKIKNGEMFLFGNKKFIKNDGIFVSMNENILDFSFVEERYTEEEILNKYDKNYYKYNHYVLNKIVFFDELDLNDILEIQKIGLEFFKNKYGWIEIDINGFLYKPNSKNRHKEPFGQINK